MAKNREKNNIYHFALILQQYNTYCSFAPSPFQASEAHSQNSAEPFRSFSEGGLGINLKNLKAKGYNIAMQTITAIVPTKNEEKNIERCVKSLLWCDKIIVIVTGADKTADIAKKLGAQIVKKIEKNKKDDFEKVQRTINWAIKTCSTDWMIRVDADEVVTDQLRDEIIRVLKLKGLKVKKSNPSNLGTLKLLNSPVAYGIPRKQFFLGTFLKGGDWAYDRLTRLFKPKFCLYDPIVKIHEQIKVNGKIGYLKRYLLHFSHPNPKTLLKKFHSYTTLEARQIKETKLSAFLKLIFSPPYIFFRWMIYHHGYRDGWIGLLAGLMRAYYEVLLYSKFIFS